MILRAGLFAPLVPRWLRLEAAREVGRRGELELLLEVARRLPEGVPPALRLWPPERRSELFGRPELEGFLEPLLAQDSWRQAMAFAGLEAPRARSMLERFPPADPIARALLMVLAERWEDYLELDLGHGFLPQALERCSAPVRARVLRSLPASGRPEVVRAAVAGVDWVSLPENEWLPRLEGVVRQSPGDLLDLLPRLRGEQALCALEMLGDWSPPPSLASAWETLRQAKLPPWRVLAEELEAPRVIARSPAPEGLLLAPGGRLAAWPGHLAPLRLPLEPSEAPGLERNLQFSPRGHLLAGAGMGLVVLGLEGERPVLLEHSLLGDEVRLGRGRWAVLSARRLSLGPNPDSVEVPDGVSAFAPLDPPGAVLATSTGRLGVFWARGRELRWAEETHPGGIVALAVRETHRRHVASAGPACLLLWRLLQVVSPSLHPVGPALPPARHLAFWRDFLVADSRLYTLETGELARELPGRVTLVADLGRALAMGLEDGSLRLWDGKGERRILGLGPVRQCVAGPEGLWVVAGTELLELREVPPAPLGELPPSWPAVEALQRFARAFAIECAEDDAPGASSHDLELG